MTHAVKEKGYKGIGMEGVTAKWYASLTRKAAEDFKALARRVAAETPRGSDVLEVAPGGDGICINQNQRGPVGVGGIVAAPTGRVVPDCISPSPVLQFQSRGMI
jgi:hypothetical protein